MIRTFRRALALLLLASFLPALGQRLSETPIQGVVRMKLQPEVTAKIGHRQLKASHGSLSTGVYALDASLKEIKGFKMTPVFPYNEKYAGERAKFGLDQWYEISIPDDVDPREARRVLSSTPGVLHSTVRVPMTLKEGNGKFVKISPEAPMPAAARALPFNDPRLSQQWHYSNDGSISGTLAGADINLFEAWKVTTGSPEVIVAIIDGGVDFTHEDLAANMLVNEAELYGKPGVDDDGNGYVDDVYGYNFCTGSGDVYPHSHGTHVAGTVAAVNNNGIGVAGVAGGDGSSGSGVRMISCQVFDSRSGSRDGDFAAAFVYAAERGASIAQCSWGWDGAGYYEQDVLDAVKYFTSMARSERLVGGLAIFSTGNNGETGDCYPACMEEVVAVAAMQADYRFAPYSNYGEWVDIVAPGGQMDYDTRLGVLSTLPDNSYGYNEGTSMASPHVSGIAALVLSKYGSSTFPMSTLKQQIVNSVNDFYSYNPEVRGLYGSGYADAAKALVMGDGSAPAEVSDIRLYPAQDNISIEWTIPEASGNSVNHHVIYYSTSEFNASSDLTKIPSVVADTRFLSSGDVFTYELGGLESMTTYYIAIKAVDRWGNASGLSPVVKTTTNAGSRMTLDTTSLNLDITGASATPKATFTIANADAGLLKWAVAARTTKSQISLASVGGPANISHSYNGTIGSARPEVLPRVAAYEEFHQADYPKTFSNATSIYAYIGDSDMSLPNAMAQQFVVPSGDFPEGFNLTHINLMGNNGSDPVVEIYGGKGIFSESNLLLRFSPEIFAYYYDVQLPEQLYFAPGESFWIVVKFPVLDKLYPLGMSTTNGSEAASKAYMSNDNGKTWVLLAEVLKDSRYQSVANTATWGISAVSKNPDWSRMLTFKPESGTVKSGETQTVVISTASNELCNGTYGAKLYFETNESAKNDLSIDLSINVTGQLPDVEASRIVPFGSLIVGESRTIEIEVYNKGYGIFAPEATPGNIFSSDISSTSEHFIVPEYVPGGFPPRQASTVRVTYSPKSAGSHTGSIIFNGPAGQQVKLMVTGAATDPAKIDVSPSIVEVGELRVGDRAVEKEFTISNKGNYPLEFVFPKYSTDTISGMSKTMIHRFGYTWDASFAEGSEVEYDGSPSLLAPVDVSSQFSDQNMFTTPVDLGFDFPYYGKNYSKVYITSFGGVVFVHDPKQYVFMYGPLTTGSNGVAGSGMISMYGHQLMMDASSRVEYAKSDGKFIINFSNVLAPVYGNDYIPVSFHMSLSPDGEVYMSYDDYDPSKVFQQGSGLFIALNDVPEKDPMVITSSDMVNGEEKYEGYDRSLYSRVKSGTAFRVYAPRPDIVAEVVPSSGLLAPGESIKVKATVKTPADIVAGDTFTDLVINSNTAGNAPEFVRFKANITGNLSPALSVAQKSVDFGKVFRTSDSKRAVNIYNSGRDAMSVTGLSLANGSFNIATTAPLTIPARQSKDVIVALPTDKEGKVSDVLTVATNAGSASVNLSGEVIGTPEMELSLSSVEQTIAYGERKALPLTIANPGNEPLDYVFSTGPHVSYVPEYSSDAKVTYSFAPSADDASVKYEWVDIVDNGLGEHVGLSAMMSADYTTLELPFEFRFYGKPYSTIYLYNVGFVSFTKRSDDRNWPEPPGEFPKGSVFSNLIAPYWGLHSPAENRTSGMYYHATEQRLVVSWMEYGNSMNYGVDFQLILNCDGTFKFQYKAHPDGAQLFNIFGCAGVANSGASEGISLSARHVEFGRAVQFAPVVSHTLAPGDSSPVDISLVADELAGSYESSIKISTNLPQNPVVEVPVKLTITGTPQPVLPDDITLEHPVGYASSDVSDPLVRMGARYSAYFEIANNGSAPFTIERIDIGSSDDVDPGMGGSYNLLSLFHHSVSEDPFTGMMQEGWYQIDGSRPITVGRDAARFAVPMLECKEADITGTYTLTATFHFKGIDVKSKTVNVNLIVTPAPEIRFDKEKIHIRQAADDHRSVETVKILNTGAYKLCYSLLLDPTGKGEDESVELPDNGAVAASSQGYAPENAEAPAAALLPALRPSDTGNNGNSLDAPQLEEFEYSDVMYYPATEGTKTVWNYGTGNTYGIFKAATWFTGPKEGFNISHIYSMSKFADYQNVDYVVEIIKGDDPTVANPIVLGRGIFHVGEKYPESDKNYTRPFVIPLERPVYINEGEDFCVVVSYPKGNDYPASLCPKADGVVSGRYMGFTEGYGWFDVARLFEEQNGSLGYIISPVQTSEGSSWIALSSGQPTEGEIAPGDAAEVKLNINAAGAPLEIGNKAMLVVKSNDPACPVANFPIYLDRNGSPVITAPSEAVVAYEGERLTVNLTVKEPDGDAISLILDDNGAISRISAIVCHDSSAEINIADDGQSATVTPTSSELKVMIELSPDFGDEGSYSLTLTADDGRGHRSSSTVAYAVEHVNRPPVAVASPTVTVALGTVSSPLSLASLFNDPDGDELTYSLTLAEEGYVTVYTADANVVFEGKKLGSVTAYVEATDTSGASTICPVNIIVTDGVGIEGVYLTNEVGIYPNPVRETLYISCGFADRATTLSLFAINGAKVFDDTLAVSAGEAVAVDMSEMPVGYYVLKVSASDGSFASFIIIKQ